MKHTSTPWSIDQINPTEAHILGAPSNFCADVIGTINTGFGTNDADRIVNCVNACAGINPAAIPDVVAALRLLTEEHIERGYADLPLGPAYQSHAINRAVAALIALEAQP